MIMVASGKAWRQNQEWPGSRLVLDGTACVKVFPKPEKVPVKRTIRRGESKQERRNSELGGREWRIDINHDAIRLLYAFDFIEEHVRQSSEKVAKYRGGTQYHA